MADFTVKNIPDKLYQSLKKSAEAHHRSINGEFIACLERVLMPSKLSAEEHLTMARRLRKESGAKVFDPEEIAAAKNESRP